MLFVKALGLNLTINANLLTRILRYYFCDFLWAYAFAFAISLIYKDYLTFNKIVLLPFSTGLVLELLQLTNITSGTFDLIDILGELLACVLVYIIVKIRSINEKNN